MAAAAVVAVVAAGAMVPWPAPVLAAEGDEVTSAGVLVLVVEVSPGVTLEGAEAVVVEVGDDGSSRRAMEVGSGTGRCSERAVDVAPGAGAIAPGLVVVGVVSPPAGGATFGGGGGVDSRRATVTGSA